jgi:GWxTD domain-containing protein
MQRCAAADLRREADSLHLYVRFPDAAVLRPSQPLRVLGWSSYEARTPQWQDTVWVPTRRLQREGTAMWAEFCLPAAALNNVQVLAVWPAAYLPDDPGTAAWLDLTPQRLTRPFILTDTTGRPLLCRYVRVREPVVVDFYGPDQPLTIRRYAAAFTPALPPHSDPATKQTTARTLSVAEEWQLRAGQWAQLPEAGTYTLQTEGGAPYGLLAQQGAFPKLTTASELIESLRYLTSTQERSNLTKAADPKRAVDGFWLRAANDQQPLARDLIRRFYSRVEDANQLFSAHKPGWMTDRGLLYIVLGAPDHVQRTATEERWQYESSTQGTYVFRAKPSTFATDYYELVRRPEYAIPWYAAVEQWRTGLNVPREAGR